MDPAIVNCDGYTSESSTSPADRIFTADPRAAYREHSDEIDAALRQVLDGTEYVLGEVVAEFERSFAEFVGARHGIGVNSGTDAIYLVLRALGIGAGDEVVAPSFTSVATVAAIEMCGAMPVLVDVEMPWRTVDPAEVSAAVTSRTRAVVAVHLYGQPADLVALRSVCDRHGVALVEDCAQAHGAVWDGAMVGSVGDVGCFSFYPTKNLGGIGDGGMVVTHDAAVADRLRSLRQYGWTAPQFSAFAGWNSRLDVVQAAVLHVKLKYLRTAIGRRREIADIYDKAFAGLPLGLPVQRPGTQHAYHLYVVETESEAVRTALLRRLETDGIVAGVHYPHGVHEQPAYAGRVRMLSMARTERLCRTIISLPGYPELDAAGRARIVDSVRGFFGA